MTKFAQQKAALTRAVNSGSFQKVVDATRKVLSEWGNVWPDDWARWQRALDDAWWHERGRYLRGEIDSMAFNYVPNLSDPFDPAWS